MQHDWKDPPMSHFGTRSPGHEGAGVVVKVGANVKNWKVGDRGGVKPLWDVCGQCELCWDGLENYCPKVVSTGLHVNGKEKEFQSCFAEVLTEGRNVSAVHHIPREIHFSDSGRSSRPYCCTDHV